MNKIYIAVEKQQPFEAYGGIYKVMQTLEDRVPLDLHYPEFFFDLDTIDYERVKIQEAYRRSIPYQYALENSAMNYLFILHHVMVFHQDMIGEMFPVFQENATMVGVGPLANAILARPMQPVSAEEASISNTPIPSEAEAIALHKRYDTPRKIKDIEILKTGRVHSLPECRLNEYACMINLDIYRKTTLPFSTNVCFGGNWGFTADLCTGWFYQMVNQGYQFRHFVLEDYAIHSLFNPVGQGIGAYSNQENYFMSERNALAYLQENFETDASLSSANALRSWLRQIRYKYPRQIVHLLRLCNRQLRARFMRKQASDS